MRLDNSSKSNFENYRISDLERIYQGIAHKREILQMKMSEDMDRGSYGDIHPRNYSIIPELERCSFNDVITLMDLCEKEFEVFWLIERKKAEKNFTLKKYNATFALYSYRDTVSDIKFIEFMNRVDEYLGEFTTTHGVIYQIMDNPNFIEEVNAL